MDSLSHVIQAISFEFSYQNLTMGLLLNQLFSPFYAAISLGVVVNFFPTLFKSPSPLLQQFQLPPLVTMFLPFILPIASVLLLSVPL